MKRLDEKIFNELEEMVKQYSCNRANLAYTELADLFNGLAEYELLKGKNYEKIVGLKEKILVCILSEVPLSIGIPNIYPAEIELNKIFSKTKIENGKFNPHPEILTELLLAFASNKDETIVSILPFVNMNAIKDLEISENVISASMKILLLNFYRLSADYRNGRYSELYNIGFNDEQIEILKSIDRELVLRVFNSLIKKWLLTTFSKEREVSIMNQSMTTLLYYISGCINYWPIYDRLIKAEMAIKLDDILVENINELLLNNELRKKKPSSFNKLVFSHLLLLNEIQELLNGISDSDNNKLQLLQIKYEDYFASVKKILNNENVIKVIGNETSLRGVKFDRITNLSLQNNKKSIL